MYSILGILYLLIFGWYLGGLVFPKEKDGWKLFFGILISLALLIIIGSIAYYLYRLDTFAIIMILVLLPFLLFTVLLFKKKKPVRLLPRFSLNTKVEPLAAILTVCFLTLEAIIFFIVWKARTALAIRSPWWPGIVPYEFFAIYFFATLLLILLTLRTANKQLSLLLVALHFFISTSIALIVYTVGYGFDPFVHRAAENLIAQQGFIHPKTFYYVGQYSLVAILSKLLALSPETIDIFLVPIAFSIIVPFVIYFVSKKLFAENTYNVFLSLSILSLPYATYIVTTPQALANIFTSAAILISPISLFGKRQNHFLYITALCVIAAVFIHPLAGLPALIFLVFIVCVIFLQDTLSGYRALNKILVLEITLLSAIIIPVTFLINSLFSKNFGTSLRLDALYHPSIIIKNINFLIPAFKNNFNLIFDAIYLYIDNLPFVFIIFSLVGLMSFRKKIQKGWLYAVVFIILFINYFMLSNFVQFTFLPENERSNYSQRLLEVSMLMLLPFALLLLHRLVKKIQQQSLWLTIGLVIMFSSSLTISVYASYPRDDNYHVDRGYNVTQDDIAAVRLIHERGGDKDYIALSSPVTAAAALREFGFYRYYKGHFYYSIPTGGPLYIFFSKMVSGDTQREVMEQAMDFMGVYHAYFVINKYWWKSEIIVEKAKEDADEWFSINNGQVYIFEYAKR